MVADTALSKPVPSGGGAYPGVDPPARQRLLNEPFFLVAVDFLIWISAAVVYILAVYRTPFGPLLAEGIFSQALKCTCRVRPPIAALRGPWEPMEEMRQANMGLVLKAKDAIVGVIETILELKDMLMDMLSRAI